MQLTLSSIHALANMYSYFIYYNVNRICQKKKERKTKYINKLRQESKDLFRPSSSKAKTIAISRWTIIELPRWRCLKGM